MATTKVEVFGNKFFNAEAYISYKKRIPDTKLNALINSGVLGMTNEFDMVFVEQGGSKALTRTYTCPLDGEPKNYDGVTTPTDDEMDTYVQTVHSYGRINSWKEKDFARDIAKENFLSLVAQKTTKYWQDAKQNTLISILKGLEGVSGFEDHVIDTEAEVDETTLNTALEQANGDNRKIYKVVVAPSTVVTALENKQLVEYVKYTNPQGIEVSTNLKTWNGKLLFEDDDCPSVVTEATAENDKYITYTIYALGLGAIDYNPLPVAVPAAVEREELTNGGITRLVERERNVFAPQGFSYVGSETSPLNSDFENSSNWELIKNSDGTKTYPSKALPFAVIKVRKVFEGTKLAG